VLARLIRVPALHFFAIGGLLFVINDWWQPAADRQSVVPVREAVVITAGQIEQLRQDFIVQSGRPPSAEQLQASIDASIDEEVLYRQAKAIGLDRNNPAIYRRLVQIARFVSADPEQSDEALYQKALQLGLDRTDLVVHRQLAMLMRVAEANTPMAGEAPPSEAELQAYLERHQDRFTEPRRIRLTHVYLSDDRHGNAAEADARDLLKKLRADRVGADDAPQLGDPFLLGHHLPWETRQGLEKILGEGFAEAAMTLGPDVWSGPIRSSFGWHLVWVHAVRPATVPSLAAVRDGVLRAVLEDRRERRVQESLKAMRSRYAIKVESPATESAIRLRIGQNG